MSPAAFAAISFTGFGPCARQRTSPQVRIGFGYNAPCCEMGGCSPGTECNAGFSSVLGFDPTAGATIRIFPPRGDSGHKPENVLFTLFHEMGHVLGFNHEQCRQGYTPPSGLSGCQSRKDPTCTVVGIGPQDLRSVFNCTGGAGPVTDPFTACDKVAFRDLYGPPPGHPLATCLGDVNGSGGVDAADQAAVSALLAGAQEIGCTEPSWNELMDVHLAFVDRSTFSPPRLWTRQPIASVRLLRRRRRRSSWSRPSSAAPSCAARCRRPAGAARRRMNGVAALAGNHRHDAGRAGRLRSRGEEPALARSGTSSTTGC